jgi:hypothetical protein
MKQVFEFSKDRDVQEVDQFGFVDINQSLSNGYVPSELSFEDSAFDGINIPDAVLDRPADVFDAMRMQDVLIDGVKNDVKKGSSPKKGGNE